MSSICVGVERCKVVSGLLWALPTPYAIVAIGSNWEMPLPINDCDESRKLSFSSFMIIEVEMHKLGVHIEDPLSSSAITYALPIELYTIYIT